MSLARFVAHNNFMSVNRTLAHKLGIHEAILLGELCSEYDYWVERNELTEDGYFFSTVENIEQKTALSAFQQRSALNNLKEQGLVEYKNQGLPPKRYIKILEEGLEALFDDKKPEQPQVVEQPVQPTQLVTRKRPIIEEPKPEVKAEEKTEEKPKKKLSRKDQLVEFVEGLGFQETTKKSLYNWIFTFGLPKGLTVELLNNKLTDLSTACNGNESMMQETIERAYLNGYFGFFPASPTYNTAPKPVVSKPAVPQYDVPAVRTHRVVDTYDGEVF